MDRILLYSSDGHASPFVEDLRPYFERKFHADLEDEIARQHGELDQRRALMETGSNQAQAQGEDYSVRVRFATELPFRQKVLEEFGYVGELMFPDSNFGNRVPFTGRFLCAVGPRRSFPDQWTAALRAYNRWLGENAIPECQVGVGLIAFHDPEYALHQVKEFRSLGLRGAMPIFDGLDPNFLPIYDVAFDPVWATCAEEELPISFHPHTGRPRDYYHQVDDNPPYSSMPFIDFQTTQAAMIFETEDLFWTRRALWHMIMGGVLERHPQLKVGFVELFTDWIPRSLERMDYLLDKARGRPNRWEDVCPRSATEYWKGQCFVGSNVWSIDEINMRSELGVETIAYGPDFPHGPSPWKRVKPYLRATVGAAGVSEHDARLMLGENMIRIYNLDEDLLHSAANRCGPEPAEILTPPGADDGAEDLTEYQRFVISHPSTSVG